MCVKDKHVCLAQESPIAMPAGRARTLVGIMLELSPHLGWWLGGGFSVVSPANIEPILVPDKFYILLH